MSNLLKRGDPSVGLEVLSRAGRSTLQGIKSASHSFHSFLADEPKKTKRKKRRKTVRKSRRASSKTTNKFYHPKVHTGWKKSLPVGERRSLALKAHKGNTLSTARGLTALANVTEDSVTERKARSDAKYFFREHRKELKKNG